MGQAEPLSRSILDPIHGLIRLSETEVALIDRPLFQRLRKIKQNGLLYLVFPAATHTRFEHSLGALFVADTMLDSVCFNSTVGAAKGTVRAIGRAHSGQAVNLVEEESASWLRRVTRLAALVHDLGHGPLSHTFDGFAPTRDRLADVLRDSRLVALTPLRDALIKWDLKDDDRGKSLDALRVPHEVMSCVLFAFLWHQVDKGNDPSTAQCVTAAILGKDVIETLADPLARQWLPLVHDMIASAPADADRMDYLERDSRAMGVTYGLFDRNRILKTLICYQSGDGDEKEYRLGLKASGLLAIENLMQARFELFVQIYYHKTNRAVSCMLDAITQEAEGSHFTLFDNADLSAWVATYCELSDDAFVSFLKGNQPKYATPNDRICQLATAIDARELWKRIYDYQGLEEAEAMAAQLGQETPGAPIIVDKVLPKATKDLKDGAKPLERGVDGVYTIEHSGSWLDAPIISALHKAEDSFVRIYLAQNDATLAKKLRRRARELELTEERPS